MKKKILFIMPHLYNGGAERSLVNLLNEFDYSKYNVDLLLFKTEGALLKQVPCNVNILKAEEYISVLFGLKEKKFYRYKIYRYFYSLIARSKDEATKKIKRWNYGYKKIIPNLDNKYDVAIGYLQWEPLFYLVDKVNAKKKIAWIHTDIALAKFSKNVLQSLTDYFLKINNIVTISDTCANSINSFFPSCSDKVRVLQNINSSKRIIENSKEFYPEEYSENIIKILSIGRLVPVKGFDTALRTAKILKEKYNLKFEWFFIGNGKLKNKLIKLQKLLEIEDCTKFLGLKENPYPYILNCDLVVQTSWYEGKSMVIDEAKILKKIAVITNYNTAKNQIIDGVNGIISDFGEENIASNIFKLLNDESLKEGITANLSSDNYDNVDEINKYYDLFEGVI